MKSQGVISEATFAFYLSDFNSPELPSSSLSFGSYDLEKYAVSNFSYVPVDWDTGAWVVPLQRLSFGKEVLEKYRKALINPTSSLILLSSDAYEAIRRSTCKLVKCNPNYTDIVFDCEKGEESVLPALTFHLGDHDYPLSPQHYIGHKDQLCYLQMLPTSSDLDILGSPFMRAYYTLFDAENYRIGLARSLNNSVPSSRWYIWLGIGVIGVVLVGGLVWYLRRPKETEQTRTSLMEPLIRTNDD